MSRSECLVRSDKGGGVVAAPFLGGLEIDADDEPSSEAKAVDEDELEATASTHVSPISSQR